MIEVIGETGTSEYMAAESIARALAKQWPGIDTSPACKEHVKIAANVKVSGYRVSDIDVVVCGVFHREKRFIAKRVIHDHTGNRVVKKPITVQNFVVAVEVKDHDESGVQISGDKIMVKYSKGGQLHWHSATDQNVNQVHSLVGYLRDVGQDAFVHRCVIMQGLGAISIGGAVAAGFSAVDFFTSLATVSRVRKTLKGYSLASGTNEIVNRVLNASIFRRVLPTALDRRRMDMIVADTPESERLFELIGKKMVQIRGHGGAGKTIMCLQAAWKAYDRKGIRSLVLTYNHALAADIRRLLGLLHVTSSLEDGGIAVDTVMSFMYSWFLNLQLIEEDDDFSFDKYEVRCRTALEMLNAGAITHDDVASLTTSYRDRFDFDCIIVDEAQDWPQAEADLLKALYGPKNICLADGINQLLRGKRTDWGAGVNAELVEVLTLGKCLRMKRNLSVFANKVAVYGGTRWEAKPNDKAGGGKVIILLRPYHNYNELHTTLLETAKNMGNAELDFLHCVPSSSVLTRDGKKYSDVGTFLATEGYDIWDGVDDSLRKDFPRSRNQFRIVQYASCRGLEGWTVVLHQADRYWEECRYRKEKEGLSDAEVMAFEDLGEVAEREAWQKAMIPLTRPIDTLVITLEALDSRFSRSLLDIARDCSDFVEVSC